MPKTSQQLRALACDATNRARQAPAAEASRLRVYARALHRRALHRRALRAELFRHSKELGRASVTIASFREHLRAQHHPTGDQP